jgi:hypothetical protein
MRDTLRALYQWGRPVTMVATIYSNRIAVAKSECLNRDMQV